MTSRIGAVARQRLVAPRTFAVARLDSAEQVSTNLPVVAAARAFDALGDPTRRAVFELLRGGPCAVVELASHLPVSRPAVSQHLRVLKEAGLVADRADGRRRLYEVNQEGVRTMRSYLDGFWDVALAAFAAAVEADNDKEQ